MLSQGSAAEATTTLYHVFGKTKVPALISDFFGDLTGGERREYVITGQNEVQLTSERKRLHAHRMVSASSRCRENRSAKGFAMMRYVGWVLAGLAAWSGVAHAQTVNDSASAKPRTVLTIWGISIGPDDKGTDDVVREFERRNPDIKVRMAKMGAGEMNPTKLMTAIVGNVAPDLVRQDRFSLSDWASRNAFVDLNPLIARDRATDPMTPTPEQYYPSVWEEASYGDGLYGIPIAADNRVLYWNPRRFQEKAKELRAAGLDPERPPRTWSETLAYSRVLTEKAPDGTLKKAGFIPNWGNSWLYMYSFQNNGSLMSEDRRRATLTAPENVEALQFMMDGYKILGGMEQANKFQAGFRGGENTPLALGLVAMYITGDWEIATYARNSPNAFFKTAPAPVPDDRFFKRGRFANEKDTFITWAGGFAFSIPRGARNVEEAWRFLKWISSKEARLLAAAGQAKLDRSRGRRFIPRVDAHIETNQEFIRLYASGDSIYEQALRSHIGMMPFARVRPQTFAAQILWDEHVRATEQACRDGKTALAALKESEDRVQKVLDQEFGKTNYPVVDLQRPVTIAIIVTLVGLIGWVAYMVRKGSERVNNSETRAGYLFIAPWLFGFLVFTVGPMAASVVFAFMQYDVLNEARFVGLRNFQDIFLNDWEILTKAFWNVGYMAVIGIPLGLITGLSIALLLNTNVKGIKFYRTAFYLPSITPAVATVFLWMWILNPDVVRGLFNSVWNVTLTPWFGVPAPGWHTTEAWSKPTLILMGLWGAGGGMILWLAGLKGISTTLYEAASIDGANPVKQFFRITLPQLSPLIFFNVVMGCIGVLQTFDSVFIMTGGNNRGPNDSLLMPVGHLFDNGFRYFRMGYASAFAWVIFAIILIITFIQFKVAPRWVHYEVDKK